ncbi:Nucleoporin nup84 [Coemansia sp. IMI 203386]|nr:Nucleoporin nup84 [Coemansia sp. IMI 203386]
MAVVDITKEFAGVVDSHDAHRQNAAESGKGVSQAKLFCQLAKKRYDQLVHEKFIVSDLYSAEEADYWKAESSTWDLLERIYALRVQSLAAGDDSCMNDDSGDLGSDCRVPERSTSLTTTDFTRAQELMASDNLLAECAELRRWLEENAPEFQPVETRKGYMFYTRKSIKDRERAAAGKTGSASNAVDRVVTEADPDSTSRQRKALAHEDAEYETSLVRTLFEYVRRGRAGNAIDLCIESDEPWRAASLKGGLLWRDSRLEPEPEIETETENGSSMRIDDAEVKDIDIRPDFPAGNINRSLWKQACAALAQDENNDLYERALYAALSGRLDEVLLVCESWEDHLWAYVNTMVETQIDLGIKDSGLLYTPAQSTTLSHIQSKHPPVRDIKLVLEALSSHDTPALRQEANEPFHRLQSAIVLNELPEYLGDYARRMQTGELDESETRILRFVIHSALHVRGLGFELPADAIDCLIERYIDTELATQYRELVASYVAQLQPGKRTEIYARFLQGISDSLPVRLNLLKVGANHGLDTAAISRRATELVLSSLETYSPLQDAAFVLAEPAAPINDKEHGQIRAIEWITSNSQLYEYALVETCRLVRRFLLCGRTNAATQLLNSLPEDFVQQEWLKSIQEPASPMPESNAQTTGNGDQAAAADPFVESSKSLQEKSHETQTCVYEYIHLLSLCDAYAQYASWAEIACKRPVDTGKVGARLQIQWLEWKDLVTASTDRTVHMLRVKLLEVDWLSTQSLCIDNSIDVAPSRLEELARLREIYIPETVVRLHSVLFATRDAISQNLKRSLDLSQLVADENLGIYRLMAKPSPLYPNARLADFMDLMRRSAFEILKVQQESHENKPPLLTEASLADSSSGGLI